MSDLHAGPRRYYGLRPIAAGPTVWALHASHHSEASSSFRGNFTQTVGSFTRLLSFLEASPRSVPYTPPRLTQLFPSRSRHFSISLSISSSWDLDQQQLLTSGAFLGTQTQRTASFSCPGPFPLVDGAKASSCWGGLRRHRPEYGTLKTRSLLEGWNG